MNKKRGDFVVNPGVYPPSDDSYLLIDTISILETDSFLEVGCGAGLMTVTAARLANIVVATDVSLNAVRNTIENLERNGCSQQVSVFQGDLLTAIQLHSRFAVIAFNPPYLPRTKYSSNLDQATIGGPEGTEITKRFLSQAANHLTPDGRIYLVCSTLSGVPKIQRVMDKMGFHVRIAATRKMFYEQLHVLEGTLQKNHTETVL